MATGSNNNTRQVGISLGVTGADQVSQATAEIQALNKTVSQTGKADITAPIKNYRTAIREAQSAAQILDQQFGRQSAQYIAAAKNVAKLKDEFEEYNASIKSFNPDNKLAIVGQLAGSVTAAIGGAVGAMSLFGLKTEDAVAITAKLQAIMALSQGLNAIKDLQSGYKDLKAVLGITTVAKEALNVADTVGTEVTEANNVVTQQQIILQNDAKIAALASALATEARTIAEAKAEEARLIAIGTTSEQIIVEQQATIARLESASAAGAQATATVATAVATETATGGVKLFNLALKASVIGLVVAALIALYQNFDLIKKKIDELIPGIGGIDNVFKNLMKGIYGVGNVFKTVFLGIANAIADFVKGDFSKIGDDIAAAFQISDAFSKGVAIKVAKDAEEAKIIRIQKEIEGNERIIKERKALGENTTALEVKNQKLKNSVLDKDDKDYAKKLADGQSEITVLLNTEAKKRADKAAADAKAKAAKQAAADKTALENIRKNNIEALKLIAEGNTSERDQAQSALDFKYKQEFDALNKRKSINKAYATDFLNLTEAKKIEEARLNKKYDNQINDYLKSVNLDTVSSYQKTRDEINKQVNELLKNASPEEKIKLETSRNEQVNKVTTLETLDNTAKDAKNNVLKVEDENRLIDYGENKDTPDAAAAKVAAINAAKRSAEDADFELKKAQLAGQNQALADLDAAHSKTIGDRAEQDSKSAIDLANAERDTKLKNFEAVSGGLSALSNLAGENTAAGKVLAVASATIDTYAGASKALAQGGFFGIASAAAVIATGLGNVKKILSVKVAKTASGGGASGLTAPTINSTVLQSAANGTNNVINAVNGTTSKVSDQRVYIVDKDLQKASDKRVVIKDNSTY